MLNTQAFADLCCTTKKTIIYYDKIGLLRPKERKGRNRVYSADQVLDFQKIMLLKSFGISLEEIKKYLYEEDLFLSVFEEKQSQLQIQKEILEKRIQKAKEFISSLKKNSLLVTPIIKKMDPYWFYSLKKKGRYIDIKKHQAEIFNLISDTDYHHQGMTIFLDENFSPEDSLMLTGIFMGGEKPESVKGVDLVSVPEHKVLSYTHVGSYSYLSYIWQVLANYTVAQDIKVNTSLNSREIYRQGVLAGISEEDLITELQIPIL